MTQLRLFTHSNIHIGIGTGVGGTGSMCPPPPPSFHKLLYKLRTTLCAASNYAPPIKKCFLRHWYNWRCKLWCCVVCSDISQHSLLKRRMFYLSVERVWWLLSVSLIVSRKQFWFDVLLSYSLACSEWVETADLAKPRTRKHSIVKGGADHYKPPLAFYCYFLVLQCRTVFATETVTGTSSFAILQLSRRW